MTNDVAHTVNNALAAVSARLEERPGWARQVLSDVGEFVDRAARTSRRPVVSLGEELEHVACFLRLEEARYEHAIALHVDLGASAPSASVRLDELRAAVASCLRRARVAGQPVGEVRIGIEGPTVSVAVEGARATVRLAPEEGE